MICCLSEPKKEIKKERNKSYHIFSIGSYCIESRCVESNRIALHRNRGESYRIASCFICIFSVSYHWLCIEMRIASASVMEMHIPNLFTESFDPSLAHTFIHWIIRSFTHSFIHWINWSFTHLFNESFDHSLTHSLNHLITHSFIHWIIWSFTHSLVHQITHSLIHLFNNSFCHSLIVLIYHIYNQLWISRSLSFSLCHITHCTL